MCDVIEQRGEATGSQTINKIEEEFKFFVDLIDNNVLIRFESVL